MEFVLLADRAAYEAGQMFGRVLAPVICAIIPIIVGHARSQAAIGWGGGLISALAAIPFACLSGFPVSMVFVVIILLMGDGNQSKYTRRRDRRRQRDDDDDYDDDDDDYDRRRRRRRRRSRDDD